MAEITAITPQKHDKTRCNIELDGRFCCGMQLETVMINRLKCGMSVTEHELARMQLQSERAQALDRALTHLTHSMKTQREMERFLKGKGYLDETVCAVLERLSELGFLNDEEYAGRYAAAAGKSKGKRLIAHELKRRGVDEEEIAQAVDEMPGQEEAARALAEKYLRGKERDVKTLQKAYAYLLRRGFEADIVRSALALGEVADDD